MNILDINKDCLLIIIEFIPIYYYFCISETSKIFKYLIDEILLKIKKNKINFKRYHLRPHDSYIIDSMELLLWAENHINFKYTSDMAKFASRLGNLDIIKYLYKNGCVIDDETWIEAIQTYNYDIIRWLKRHIKIKDIDWVFAHACKYASTKKERIKILDFFLTNYDVRDKQNIFCRYAINGDNLDTLKWLIENDFIFDRLSFDIASGNGNINILKYLYNVATHDLSIISWWSESTMTSAAASGHLEILKWLRKKCCPWGISTTFYALVYAFENNKDTGCLKWLLENGCPVDHRVLEHFGELKINYNFDELNIVG